MVAARRLRWLIENTVDHDKSWDDANSTPELAWDTRKGFRGVGNENTIDNANWGRLL